MKKVVNKIIKHPIKSSISFGIVCSGIACIVKATKGKRKK